MRPPHKDVRRSPAGFDSSLLQTANRQRWCIEAHAVRCSSNGAGSRGYNSDIASLASCRHRAHQQAPYGGSSGRRPSKRQPSPPQLPRRYSGPEADVELMYGSEGSAASDYDLEAFGPVDVDPTLTESEWLRSQGIDPDALDEGEGEAAPVAVLSLAEVSYSRDIDSVNKAEREQHIKAANALWGAQALAATDRRSRAATRTNPPPPPTPPPLTSMLSAPPSTGHAATEHASSAALLHRQHHPLVRASTL
ncbi:hypothetical protein JKP88DRAFT_267198 [Tribonema minus]|uniref:Uncharacterized protein n=1 Tax=Tribonema minus TaxID=303371 RepID=A0A835ZAH7_9STRA|nr:hypothetical protein JKP88DRAFT_267198 [Tribonema minus]